MSILVSIYIVTRNRCALLKRCVESALNQTYKNIEVLIVDDGSDDGTVEYLDGLSKDSRVRVFFNSSRRGACYSRNVAIQDAKGYFITGIDDDDFISKDRIASFVRAWDEDSPNLKALYSDAIRIEPGKEVSLCRVDHVIKNSLWRENYIGNQVFTKLIFLRDIGGFDPELPAWQDLDCWIRLLDSCNESYAKRVPIKTYFFDCSHDYGRISDGKGALIRQAFFLFKDKYSLDSYQESCLKLQMYAYPGVSFSFKQLILSISELRFYVILKSIKIYIKKTFSKR